MTTDLYLNIFSNCNW